MNSFSSGAVLTAALTLLSVACSAAQSSFSAGQNVSASGEKKSAQAEGAKKAEPAPSPSQPKPTATATLPSAIKSQECWFAVSGTYVGLGDYSDTFPKPTSGKPIATGEKFDTVGGVFLAARAEPYVYKEGGGEIDGAVDSTFDGIVVPPGMSVEIRASAADAPIYKGQGPLIAIAGSSSGSSYGSPFTYKSKYDAGELKHWPQWMQDYLSTNAGRVEIIPTHPARWVKVSVVEGGRCAN
ncbi:MAG: hypothetical protein FJY29_04695 [Betaproteobacteria bacterium]|nr:hypothetical protein [Betaproteobacteria bacterium]